MIIIFKILFQIKNYLRQNIVQEFSFKKEVYITNYLFIITNNKIKFKNKWESINILTLFMILLLLNIIG